MISADVFYFKIISNNKNPTFIFQKTDLNQEVSAVNRSWMEVGQQGAAATGGGHQASWSRLTGGFTWHSVKINKHDDI